MQIAPEINVQLVTLLLSLGVLLVVTVAFLFLFILEKNKTLLSLFFMGFVTLLFVITKYLVILESGVYFHAYKARVMYRYEQIFFSYYLAVFPFLTTYLLRLKDYLKKISLMMSGVGLFVALFLSIVAFVKPELFVSIHGVLSQYSVMGGGPRRNEGILFIGRDILLFLFVFYCFIVAFYITSSKRHSVKKQLVLLFAFLFVTFFYLDEIFYLYTGVHFVFFGNANFPRFSVGLTMTTLIVSFCIIEYFLHQKKTLDTVAAALNQSDARFMQIAMNISEVFWLIEYHLQHRTFNLIFINQAYDRIWGRSSAVLFKDFTLWSESVHKDDRDMVGEKMINFDKIHNQELFFRIQTPNGSERWIKDRFTQVTAGKNGVITVARISEDVTEQKMMEERISYMAFFDPLTGLMNRRSFDNKLVEMIKHSQRSIPEKLIGLLFLDLDGFKDINESFGNEIGDDLLKQVAGRIFSCIRGTDYLFRSVGDEFIVILTNLQNSMDAGIVAQKIIDSLLKGFSVFGHYLYVGVSIGITLYPQDGEQPEELVSKASTALYDAKKEQNLYKFYAKSMGKKALEKVTILTSIKKALNNDEFQLYYQPIVTIDGVLIGAEALIRWHHPVWGIVPPSKFIGIAEETMMIQSIGDFVINRACEEWSILHTSTGAHLFFSINVSVKQFKECDIVERIIAARDRSGMNANDLHVEVTESIFLDSVDHTIEKLHQLRKHGVFISLDDFGTGYSSLSYLEKVPISTVKIDRSFIVDIPTQKKGSPLVESIVDIASRLNLAIIVEGIENYEQWRYLRSLTNAASMQGFLFSKPLPFKEFVQFVSAKKQFFYGADDAGGIGYSREGEGIT